MSSAATANSNDQPSTSSMKVEDTKKPKEVDENGLLKLLMEYCRAFIAKKTNKEEAVKQLRAILQNSPETGASLLFDVLIALQPEFDEERGRKEERADEIREFMEQIGKELLPLDVLSLELNALGADMPTTKSKIVKCKTRVYYKQLKFNLLREESEGYAKLIAELLEPSSPEKHLILTVDCLIGQFNLDPNRVIDIILECFENSPHNRELYIRLIQDFKVDKEDLRNILVIKFIFCQRAEHTPMSLYRLASLLAQVGLVDVLALFCSVNPTQKEIIDENKALAELIRVRSFRAETISSSSASMLALANESYPISSILTGPNDTGPEPSAIMPAVSFSAALQCQQNDDRKLAGTRFDDVVLYKNQKLGLLCALLEHGAWELAKPLMDRLPEIYPFGVCRRIAMDVANIIGYKIEPFYREKYSHYRDNSGQKMKESWERFTCPPGTITDWHSLFNDACQIALQLGPYIGARHNVAIKLIRLLNLFYEDPEAQTMMDSENLFHMIIDLCDSCLVPAASLLESNFSYCEELWQILGRFSYQDRYRIYHRWRTIHTDRCWDLNLQRGKVLGMTRYIMKRLSKETAKVMGRQLGKLCHTYPTIPLDYLLSKVQDFQNFIQPVVESIRFLSSLEFDVLSYCLIENLAAPEKQDFKISDISYSPWLQSLACVSAAIFKRYAIDFGGIIQYIANQLKDQKNLDLIVLRQIVTSISGVEYSTDLTQEHLDALCGGDTLRGEASYLQLTRDKDAKLNRRAINRLRDALLKDSLFEALCILIGQQKQLIIYRDYKEYPLKLTTQMLDQCQETFIQFLHFLRTNLKPEQYAKRIPSALALLTEYHLPVEAAFALTRPIYMNEIETAYNSAKLKKKEEAKVNKLDAAQKSEQFNEIFLLKLDALGEELKMAFPETFWTDLTFRMHTIFWLLSVNDLICPENAYERGIEKCRKELQALKDGGETSERGQQKRTTKDEERLKALEQKLVDEKRRQIEHNSRILDILRDEQVRKTFFGFQNKAGQMLRFLQFCVLPRAVCSEVDAVYCAKFVETLHAVKTDDFQTIVLFDKIFTDVTPILAGLSERETMCFGRFACMILELIQRWHSKEEHYKKECDGFPGCDTKVRKKDNVLVDKPTNTFSYELFRSLCYKWQVRLSKSFAFMLTGKEKNYVLIRNALTMMLKILPTYPLLIPMNNNLEEQVKQVIEQEKGNRQDLNLLANSYLVQLKKRNDQWKMPGHFEKTGRKLWTNAEFSDMRQTGTRGRVGLGAKTPSPTTITTKKPPITAPESGSSSRSTRAHSPVSSKLHALLDSSPPKRSRPPIRSSGSSKRID